MAGDKSKTPRFSNQQKSSPTREALHSGAAVEMVGVNFLDRQSKFQRPFQIPRTFLRLPELKFCEEIRSFDRFHLPLRHVDTEVRNTLPNAADIAREAAILEEIENMKKRKL